MKVSKPCHRKAELSAPLLLVPESVLPVLQNRTPVRSHKVTDTELEKIHLTSLQSILREEDEKDGLLYEFLGIEGKWDFFVGCDMRIVLVRRRWTQIG